MGLSIPTLIIMFVKSVAISTWPLGIRGEKTGKLNDEDWPAKHLHGKVSELAVQSLQCNVEDYMPNANAKERHLDSSQQLNKQEEPDSSKPKESTMTYYIIFIIAYKRKQYPDKQHTIVALSVMLLTVGTRRCALIT